MGLLPDEERYLTWGEDVVLSVHLHASALIRPVAEAVLVVAVGFWFATIGVPVLDVLAVVAFAGALLRLAWTVAAWAAERIVLTDRRIFKLGGLLSRRVDSMPLRRVTDFSYRRSPLGMVLGYGTFVVETAGQEQALSRIEHLPNPDGFYRTVAWLVFGDTREPTTERLRA